MDPKEGTSMESLVDRLDRLFPGEARSSDRLRCLLASAGMSLTRQKISDILAGRRSLPQKAEHELAILEAKQDLRELLQIAWHEFGVSVFWSCSQAFVMAPENACAVAEELRHGNRNAFLHADRVIKAQKRLLETERREPDHEDPERAHTVCERR